MATHQKNSKAIREGQQGGPAQKNQAARGGRGAERDLKGPSRVQQDDDSLPLRQQQAELDSKQGSINPGQTGTPGGKGKQDAPQNQKR